MTTREPRPGDICSFVVNSKIIHALIVQTCGDYRDPLLLVIDSQYRTYRKYPESVRLPGVRWLKSKPDVLLSEEDAPSILASLLIVASSNRGHRMVENARARANRDAPNPAPGRGQLEPYEAPLKMAEGFTGWPTTQLLRYCACRGGYEEKYERMAQQHHNVAEFVYQVGWKGERERRMKDLLGDAA